MLSKETIKRTLRRAGSAFVTGAIAAFALVPVDLSEPKRYVIVLGIAMIAGGLMGLQKLVTGYLKYDIKR